MTVPVKIVEIKPRLRAPRIEDWPVIFTLISENAALGTICEEMGLHKATVVNPISESDELTRDFTVAQAMRAEKLAERAIVCADGVLEGTVDPKLAKVAMPIYQWAAAQLDPSRWGRSTTRTEITGLGGKDLQLGNNVVVFNLPENTR
jgi:hypothetical protein